VVKFTKTSNIWHDASYTNGQVDAYAEDTNISGNFDIGDVTVKLPEGVYGTVTITVNSVIFGDADYNDISTGITGSKADINIEKKEEPSSQVTPSIPSSEGDKKEEPKSTEEPKNTDKDDSSNTEVDEIYLDDIIVEGYDLNFSKEVYDYILNIKNETSLNITPVVEDEMADYSISGNENLENGSVISIKVTLSDKEKIYTIKVQKDDTVDKKQGIDYVKIAFIVIISILVLVNLFRLLSRSKRRENNQWRRY